MDRGRFSSRIITISPPGPLAQQIRAAGIEIETLNCSTAIQAPRALSQLVRRIRQLKPDIVQTWPYHADLFGALALRLLIAPCTWSSSRDLEWARSFGASLPMRMTASWFRILTDRPNTSLWREVRA